jgi:hypothetical protein
MKSSPSTQNNEGSCNNSQLPARTNHTSNATKPHDPPATGNPCPECDCTTSAENGGSAAHGSPIEAASERPGHTDYNLGHRLSRTELGSPTRNGDR